MKSPREAETHRLIAGDSCLDFVNTLNGHDRLRGHEYLHDFTDLILWSKHARLLSAHQATLILREASRFPRMSHAVFRRTLQLRESLFRVFHAIAMAQEPPAADVRRLDGAWHQGQRHASLRRAGAVFTRGWDDDPLLDRIPRLLTVYAVDLLTSSEVERVRACLGNDCDWLFIDRSRNHQRRWCSMDECGNRAKMRRRRERQKRMGPIRVLPGAPLSSVTG